MLSEPVIDKILESPPVAPRRKAIGNAADKVFDTLRADIVAGELLPGDLLPRNALARRFGVSLTPVRDALSLLEARGLVTVFAQSRTVVALIEREALFELQFQRVALERDVVRKLAKRPGIEHLQHAARLLEDEVGFHRCLFNGVGMGRVFDARWSRCDRLRRCRNLVPEEPERRRLARDFRRQVLERIAAGDATGADAAMRALLADDMADIGRVEKLFPDYFSDG